MKTILYILITPCLLILFFLLDWLFVFDDLTQAKVVGRELVEMSSGADIVYHRHVTIDYFGDITRLSAERHDYCSTALGVDMPIVVRRGLFTKMIYGYKLKT